MLRGLESLRSARDGGVLPLGQGETKWLGRLTAATHELPEEESAFVQQMLGRVHRSKFLLDQRSRRASGSCCRCSWSTSAGIHAVRLRVCGSRRACARQEEVQFVMMPFALLLLSGYLLVNAAIASPDATWLRIDSFLPPPRAALMPARIALGHISAWEALLQALLMGLSIFGLGRLTSRACASSLDPRWRETRLAPRCVPAGPGRKSHASQKHNPGITLDPSRRHPPCLGTS